MAQELASSLYVPEACGLVFAGGDDGTAIGLKAADLYPARVALELAEFVAGLVRPRGVQFCRRWR